MADAVSYRGRTGRGGRRWWDGGGGRSWKRTFASGYQKRSMDCHGRWRCGACFGWIFFVRELLALVLVQLVLVFLAAIGGNIFLVLVVANFRQGVLRVTMNLFVVTDILIVVLLDLNDADPTSLRTSGGRRPRHLRCPLPLFVSWLLP